MMSNPDLITQELDIMASQIKAWSHSRLSNFEKCKLRAKLLYVDRLEEPRQPLRPGQTEYANDRGTRIHEAAELFVRGGVELIPELNAFEAEFKELRSLFEAGKVALEGDWAFNKDWEPVGFKSADAWLRMKLDALVTMSKEHLLVIDYKTGKRYGNELKHAEQTQLYAVGCMMRYPGIKKITTELWYPDLDDLIRNEYSFEQVSKFFKPWNNRGITITSETEFPPNPNRYSCQYCMFGKKGSGVCKVGV